MSDKPPVIPLKYRMSGPDQPVAPKRAAMPPRKPRVTHWEALFRVVIVLVILVSVAVAYWSFFHRFLPRQKEARAMVTRVSGMSAKLDQLERRWTPEVIEETRTRYREVYRQLFADQSALEEWLAQIQISAAPLALELTVGFGQSTPTEQFATNLAIIPASISLEVQPLPGGDTQGATPYERVLEFGQLLAAHGKRADLAELNVTGGVGSIQRAVLVFNLWAGDLGNETAAATPASHNPR